MAERLGNIGSRYEWPTFPNGLLDAAVVNERALLAQRSGLARLPGYELIGKVSSSVVYLARGEQMVASQPGELEAMHLLGSYSPDYGALRHIVYSHGSQAELRNEALVEMDTLCPGGYFDVDCGCGDRKETAIQSLYNTDPTAAMYVSLDTFTPPVDSPQTMRDILRGMGVSDIRYNSPFLAGPCSTRNKLLASPRALEIYRGSKGSPFILTADIPVTFRGGNPARLRVIEEPVKSEIRDYNKRPKRHYVFSVGDIANTIPVVRYHSACITAELGGNGCDCHFQLQQTLGYIQEHGSGMIIYGDEEGMDLGLALKFAQTQYTGRGVTDLLTARESELGLPGDLRTYELVSVVRQITGLKAARVASNNRTKFAAFEANGVEIVGTYPIQADLDKLAPQAVPDIQAKKDSGRYLDY